MIKITIEREGKEPEVIECEQFILRADDSEGVITIGNPNMDLLSTSALYLTEMARIETINNIKGE